jgi:hypothetical protein
VYCSGTLVLKSGQNAGSTGNCIEAVANVWFPVIFSVAEPHQFYAAPAPGKNFDAAPAAPAPTLLYSRPKFLKRIKVS